jgi:hypothetical protein
MFSAGPRTWLANCCALGNKRMLQKVWYNSDKLHHCQLLEKILPQGFVYSRTPKGRTSALWAYK